MMPGCVAVGYQHFVWLFHRMMGRAARRFPNGRMGLQAVTSHLGRASTAADLVNVDVAEVDLTIMSGIVTVRRSVQIGGAAGVGPIIVRSIMKSKKVRKRIKNVVLETEKGRKYSVARSPSLLFCYHVLGRSSLLRRDLHRLD